MMAGERLHDISPVQNNQLYAKTRLASHNLHVLADAVCICAHQVAMRQAFQEAGCVFCVIAPYNPSASTIGGQR